MRRLTGLFLTVCFWLWTDRSYGQVQEQLPEQQTEDSLMQVLGNIPAFTIYKDNYLITGTNFSGGKVNEYTSDVKFQISLRHRLYKGLLPFRTYLFLTYTQKSFWNIYRKSGPFSDNNYNPTLGIGRNFIHNKRIEWIGMLQLEHESNGRDSISSRSWNRITFLAIYMPDGNLTLQAKAWIPINVSLMNKHITQYVGIGHLAATYTDDNRNWGCSAVMIKRGGWNLNANWQVQIACRLFKQNNQFLFFQMYSGYGESMLDFNKYNRYFRLGFVIKPNSVSIF